MNLVLVDTLSQVLGPQLTPGAAKAWMSLLATMVKVVSAEIDRLDEETAVLLTEKIKARKAQDLAANQIAGKWGKTISLVENKNETE